MAHESPKRSVSTRRYPRRRSLKDKIVTTIRMKEAGLRYQYSRHSAAEDDEIEQENSHDKFKKAVGDRRNRSLYLVNQEIRADRAACRVVRAPHGFCRPFLGSAIGRLYQLLPIRFSISGVERANWRSRPDWFGFVYNLCSYCQLLLRGRDHRGRRSLFSRLRVRYRRRSKTFHSSIIYRNPRLLDILFDGAPSLRASDVTDLAALTISTS